VTLGASESKSCRGKRAARGSRSQMLLLLLLLLLLQVLMVVAAAAVVVVVMVVVVVVREGQRSSVRGRTASYLEDNFARKLRR
jgi:flagellar basal body-associated protein FliL